MILPRLTLKAPKRLHEKVSFVSTPLSRKWLRFVRLRNLLHLPASDWCISFVFDLPVPSTFHHVTSEALLSPTSMKDLLGSIHPNVLFQ